MGPSTFLTSKEEEGANVSEGRIRQWFLDVKTYLQENNYLDITNDPRRVFNTDETAFFLSPKGGKVLAKKGDKTIYNRISTNEKECITTLITGSASGELPPPMMVFAYERIPASIAASTPASWAIVSLYPNATHILQPMDVAIFHPLKSRWKEVVMKWRIAHNADRLRKEHFSILLTKALETITPEMLANGFRIMWPLSI
ncbi:hypothetical protein NQ315_008999 [Exocentrus adspersus]|uniref:DDE-1 domain-containing protein n=1 Tax=Exocentrus adspersus TaxID=1586481 RepID=A0AAV8VFN1_9CUCU|nr:hypothetical protein NQ315_008999 [Exocentrus adspersus]